MSIIQAGYRITVVSWENDGDNYRTLTQDGLLYENVAFIVDCLKLLSGDWGNMFLPDDKELEEFSDHIRQVFKKYPTFIPPDVNTTDEVLDYFMEIVLAYTGYAEYSTRVVESITVEYVPERIEIKDVTKEFV